MRRLLFEVNVMLDVLLDRKPFSETASAVWEFVELGEAEGMLSAHAFTTIHYLNGRDAVGAAARAATEALLSVFEVAPVDRGVLDSALALGWNDFEDAVTAAAARRAKCDVIVTRNPSDFPRSPVRVLLPAEAVAWLTVSR
ncbi:MAG TPA: PIN domain-containing protein [Vicinamibacterales bacterium]|nr:PIN domain-containing protein [Vicinamibacterales bacterium]